MSRALRGAMSGGARLSAAALLCLLAAAAPGAAQEICGEHEVAPGETLGGIAEQVYGRPLTERIYQANRDRLSGPDVIRPGQVLRLPCAPEGGGDGETAQGAPGRDPAPGDETGAETGSETGAETGGPGTGAPGPAPLAPPTQGPPAPGAPAAALAPAVDPEAPLTLAAPPGPEGPALARLRAALAGRAVETVHRADPVRALHPDGAALLAAPTPEPGCARLERLSVSEAALCVRHDWSARLGATRMVWLAPEGSELAGAAAPSALRGKRLCRPEGMPEGDLIRAGLTPPRIARLAPAGAADCLRAVLAGEADAAGLPAPAAGAALAALGARAAGLVEIPGLEGEIAWHAVSRKDSALGRAALEALDRGLDQGLDRGLAAQTEGEDAGGVAETDGAGAADAGPAD